MAECIGSGTNQTNIKHDVKENLSWLIDLQHFLGFILTKKKKGIILFSSG